MEALDTLQRYLLGVINSDRACPDELAICAAVSDVERPPLHYPNDFGQFLKKAVE